jgi:hypothetical protein
VVVSTGTCDLDDSSCETIASGHLVAGRYSFLNVSDNGCGMDDVTQARLFDPYFTTKPTGQGLGMASVRRIVTAQGGIIQIQSRRGAGTCIRVLFPSSTGPAGYVSLEDGCINEFVQRGTRGSPSRSAFMEMGGREIAPSEGSRATETAIRGFWRGYRELMGL